jgi:cell wall-associated NlpC family hydrolase
MRKPLVALSLAVGASLGAPTVAQVLAAQTASTHLNSSPTNSSKNSSTVTPAVRSNNTVSGAAIVQRGLRYIGYPYTAVGNSPSTGFSCIGFASFVYRSMGIPLPGDLQDALNYAPQVPFSQLQPGDLLYFQNTIWNGLSHVAIYIGGGRFVHAEWYGKGVRISSFNNDPSDDITSTVPKQALR